MHICQIHVTPEILGRDWQSPIIIQTGASRALGLAILEILLSRHDARITTLSPESSPQLQLVVKEDGHDRVSTAQGGVGDVETNARVVRETVKKWGELDGVDIRMLDRSNLSVRLIAPTYILANGSDRWSQSRRYPTRTSTLKCPNQPPLRSLPHPTSLTLPATIWRRNRQDRTRLVWLVRLGAIRLGDCTRW